MTGMFLLILILACLRLFERAMNRSIIPFDPRDRIEHRLHMDRRPRELPAPKDLTTRSYDPIADAQLKRALDRRRQSNPDSGHRRRKSDQ
jgi:hypothetical protein